MPTFTEPTWTTPEDADFESAFYKKDYRGFELAGAIVRLLQYHFSDADNIENTKLKTYIWTSTPSTSKIFIGLAYERNDKESMTKPSIYVERQEVMADNAGAVRYLQVCAANATMNDPNYLKHMTGTFNLVCEGVTGGDVDAMADEVFQRMMYFSPIIRDDFALDEFDVKGIGKVARKGESQKGFICPVIITWQKITRWRVADQAPY